MDRYGQFGKRLRVFDAYRSWVDTIDRQIQEGRLQEAETKTDFAQFLLGPIRKSVYKGYSKVEPQYRRYAAIETAEDFKEHRIVGLNSLQGIGYVGDDGDYPEMGRTERPPARIVVDTYGGNHKITRQAVRNDNMGELVRRIPEDMGRAMSRFVAETIVALIESNPDAPDGDPMYHVNHGNVATAALSEDSLATEISAMEDQEDDDGNPIVVTPDRLIIRNVRMQLIANRILNSQQTAANVAYTGAAGAGGQIMDKGLNNPMSGVLPADGIVRDPFFSDDTDWYLFADPSEIPAFALAFLDGQEQPFVGLKNPEVRNALGAGEDEYEFDVDNLAYKVRHDFGAAPVDPRGTRRSVVAG
jgi:phage major head subunit gpT-like protein